MSTGHATPGTSTPRTAAAIYAATGISWTDWVAWLDASDARGMSHPEIAALAQARMSAGTDVDVENAGWWAQSVTVAYEQQIGRRVPGQRQDGTFYVSASRTVPLEPGTAMAVWQAHRGESDSLGGFVPAEPARTSSTPKRLYWRVAFTDGSTLQVAFEPRPSGSQLTVTHEGLPSIEAREETRRLWRVVLADLVFP